MSIACKCLNIIVEFKDIYLKAAKCESPTLATVEELENFFKEDVKEVEIITVSKQIDTLIQEISTRDWVVKRCLNCSVNCYAINAKKTTALINLSLLTNSKEISIMKNHKNFSPVFNVIIQPVGEHIKEDDLRPEQLAGKIQCILSLIQEQLKTSIRQEVNKTEVNIRKYTENQYLLLNEFQHRANKDHKALMCKIYEVLVPAENPVENFSSDVEKENCEKEDEKSEVNRHVISNKNSFSKKVLQEKKSRKFRHSSRSINTYSKASENGKGSLDSEGLFVLEGMEGAVSEPFHSEEESDTDQGDSESHDEGIDVHSKLPSSSSIQLARSMPVNVPVYSVAFSDFEEDKEPTDVIDIAASIKALARSVHGDAMFGDLPRPRFSTQI